MTCSPHADTLRPEGFVGHSTAFEGSLRAGGGRTVHTLRAPVSSDTEVGRQIRDERRAQGLTLKQVAGAIGVTAAQLHRYEVGATRIATSRLTSIAEALHVSPSAFFAGGSTPKPSRSSPAMLETGVDICDLIQIFSALRTDDERRALISVAKMMAGQSATAG